MAQNRQGFRNFITHPLWQFLAALAAIIALLLGIFVWFIPNYNSLFAHSVSITPTPSFSPTQQAKTPTTIGATPIPTVDPLSASKLIPNYAPKLGDPLDGSNNPNQWETDQEGSATCSFSQGTYQIVAPPNSTGGECNTQSPATNFTNFVYQIKMKIIQGLSTQSTGTAGLAFCVSDALNGSFYGLSFNASGYWNFGILTNGNSPNAQSRLIKSGSIKYFLRGQDDWNYITVRVQNHVIDAQVNGHDLFSMPDTTLAGGMIGVVLSPGPEHADVAFSDARVWQL